jgi:hypothetical protein
MARIISILLLCLGSLSGIAQASHQLQMGEIYTGQFDPGAGNGIPFLAVDGNYNDAIEQVLNDNVTVNLSGGSLLLNVRLKDAYNHWGPVFKKAWVYTPVVNGTPRDIKITAGEIYTGQFDPGAGNGIPFLVFDGNYNDAIEQVLNDNVAVNLSGGSLLLNVRLKDASNHWGPVFKNAWVYMPVVNGTPREIKITAGEIYTGQFDPGAGNGTPFLVFDGNYNDAIEQVLNDNVAVNLSSGSLLLNVRLKDASNHWGPVFKKAWVYTPVVNGTPRDIKITAGEIYTGQFDPGAGNGIPFLVFDGNYNDAIEQVLNDNVAVNLSGGSLLLNVRLKDAYNHWGPVFKKAWVYTPVVNGTPRDIKITAGEYFFGQFDPGAGNGTPILATDGSFNDAIESVLRTWLTWNTTASPSLFNIRLRDASQQWGPVFRKVIFPSGANNTVNLIAEGDSIKLCGGNTLTLHYAGPNGYTVNWFNNTHLDSVVFTPTLSGYYSINVQLGNSNYSDSIYVSFYSNPQPNISPSGNVMVCGSGTLYLTTTPLPTTNYQWYYNGNVISGATSASYLPTQLGVYKVRAINTITNCISFSDTTRLYVTPQITTNVSTSNCAQTYILSAGAGSGHTFQWKLNGNNISGAIQSTYSPTVSGNYSVVVSNSNCNATTAAVNIIIVPAITANITASGAVNFCQGGSVTLSTPLASGQTYQWYNGNSIIAGATQHTFVALNTGSYSVSVTNSQNCVLYSNAIQVTVQPMPTVNPVGNMLYCNGQNVAAVALQGTPANVSFSISGGASRGLPNQSNVNAIPAFTATSAGNSIVTIVPNANGCVGAATTYTLTVSNCPPVSVNLKFYIQGYYQGAGLMRQVLYNQGETLDPNSVSTDFVIVELHNVNPPYAMSKSTIATLKTNGTLTCSFPGSTTNSSYYIVIKHRNTIETWSSSPVMIVPNVTYDFSTMASKAYGNNQINISGNGSIWAFYNGDVNQDANIDLLDLNNIEYDINVFQFGYQASDVNGDGNVDLLDLPLIEDNINQFVFSIHP